MRGLEHGKRIVEGDMASAVVIVVGLRCAGGVDARALFKCRARAFLTAALHPSFIAISSVLLRPSLRLHLLLLVVLQQPDQRRRLLLARELRHPRLDRGRQGREEGLQARGPLRVQLLRRLARGRGRRAAGVGPRVLGQRVVHPGARAGRVPALGPARALATHLVLQRRAKPGRPRLPLLLLLLHGQGLLPRRQEVPAVQLLQRGPLLGRGHGPQLVPLLRRHARQDALDGRLLRLHGQRV